MFWLALRYYKTVNKCNTFEILFCVITVCKVGIILPLYFLRDINLLYFVFVINSFSTYLFSHVLRLRACVALNRPRQKVQETQWMGYIQFGNFILWVIISPMFDRTRTYEILMRCDLAYVYPFRFVIVFAIDLLYALIELWRTLSSPTFSSEKDRL